MKNVFGLQPKLGTKAYHIWCKNQDYFLKLKKEARKFSLMEPPFTEKSINRYKFILSMMTDLTLGKFVR